MFSQPRPSPNPGKNQRELLWTCKARPKQLSLKISPLFPGQERGVGGDRSNYVVHKATRKIKFGVPYSFPLAVQQRNKHITDKGLLDLGKIDRLPV